MNETSPTTEAESTPVPPEDLPAAPADADDRADTDEGAGTPPPAVRRRSFYADAWRHLPRDLGYLALTALLLATVYFALPTAVYSLFDSLLWSASGLFAAVALLVALFAARGLGAVERVRIGWADPRPIRPVDWTPRWQQNRAMRILSAVANPHYWLHLLHAVVVYPLVAFVTLGAGALLSPGSSGRSPAASRSSATAGASSRCSPTTATTRDAPSRSPASSA